MERQQAALPNEEPLSQCPCEKGENTEECLMQSKSFRQGLRNILPLHVKDSQTTQRLTALGLVPSFVNAIALSLVEKAADGDLSAAKFVREAVGEKNADTTGRNVRSIDLTQLKDKQLEELADQLEEGDAL